MQIKMQNGHKNVTEMQNNDIKYAEYSLISPNNDD